MLSLLAWLGSRSSVYTVTDKRVVMRIGIVLSISFNLPYRMIESVGLRANADATGDIVLALSATHDRIAYVHLWPHARPWRVKRTEPMLRAVPNAALVARVLSNALAQQAGLAAPPAGAARPVAAAAGAERPEPALGTVRVLAA